MSDAFSRLHGGCRLSMQVSIVEVDGLWLGLSFQVTPVIQVTSVISSAAGNDSIPVISSVARNLEAMGQDFSLRSK